MLHNSLFKSPLHDLHPLDLCSIQFQQKDMMNSLSALRFICNVSDKSFPLVASHNDKGQQSKHHKKNKNMMLLCLYCDQVNSRAVTNIL